jgi:hypothetical protein
MGITFTGGKYIEKILKPNAVFPTFYYFVSEHQ